MENRFFYCYSLKLKDFLKSQGFKFIAKGLHPKTGRPFFMFDKSNQLDMAINKWNEIKYK